MGLKPRKIAISFWRINPDTDNDYSAQLLEEGFAALDCGKLDSIIKGSTHALDCYSVTDSGDYITGALVSNQHADLPLTYTQQKKEFGLVPLVEGQGLGRVNCFVFEKRRRILLLESPGEGYSTARDWCLYFRAMLLKEKEGRLPAIHPAIIERPDARAVFNRFIRVTRLRFRIARLRDVSMFKDEAVREAITASFRAATDSGSDEVICEFIVPNRPPKKRETDLGPNPTLERTFVDKIVGAFSALGPGEITQLSVTGEEEDIEKLTPLNLLSSRVTDFISAVPFTDKDLPSSTAVRHRCEMIKELFEKHTEAIQSVGGL